MADTVLYEERQIFPRRFALWFALAMNVVVVVVLLLPPRRPLASSWSLFLLANGTTVFTFGLVWIALRTAPIRLDERYLHPPWRPAIALDQISEARIVEGDELKQISKTLERGSRSLPAGAGLAAVPGIGLAGLDLAQASSLRRRRKDPVFRGLVATTGARWAIYLETDESAGPTRRWLFGTKHSDEFMAALDGAMAARSAHGGR